VHWATAHQRPKPSSRWTKGRSCTNFQYGPLKWGCSVLKKYIIIIIICLLQPLELPGTIK
jgi:hypothetical protein